MKTLTYLLAILTLFVMSCEPVEETPPEPSFNYQAYLTGDWRYNPVEGEPIFYIYSFTASTYQVTYFTQTLVHETNTPGYWVNPQNAEITLAMATYYVPTKWYPDPTKPEFEIVMVAHYIDWGTLTIDVINDNEMVLIDANGNEYSFSKNIK